MDTLLKLIIDLVLVFANSGDEQIDPDFAVEQLEKISAGLKQLEPDMLQAFIEKIDDEASAATKLGNREYANQLRQLPSDLGLN
jgi:predicted oxidoreductase